MQAQGLNGGPNKEVPFLVPHPPKLLFPSRGGVPASLELPSSEHRGKLCEQGSGGPRMKKEGILKEASCPGLTFSAL